MVLPLLNRLNLDCIPRLESTQFLNIRTPYESLETNVTYFINNLITRVLIVRNQTLRQLATSYSVLLEIINAN